MQGYIRNKQEACALKTLKRCGIGPGAHSRPEGIARFNVSVQSGSIMYDSIDDIFRDMRAYFVPDYIGVESARPDGRGTNAAIIDKLEAQVRAWAADDRPFWRDSRDMLWGNSYRYSGGLSVKRTTDKTGNTKFQLTLRGGTIDEPTEQIDNFAAYVDKDVQYGGDMQIRYVAAPPAELASRVIKGKHEDEQVVAVSMPGKLCL